MEIKSGIEQEIEYIKMGMTTLALELKRIGEDLEKISKKPTESIQPDAIEEAGGIVPAVQAAYLPDHQG